MDITESVHCGFRRVFKSSITNVVVNQIKTKPIRRLQITIKVYFFVENFFLKHVTSYGNSKILELILINLEWLERLKIIFGAIIEKWRLQISLKPFRVVTSLTVGTRDIRFSNVFRDSISEINTKLAIFHRCFRNDNRGQETRVLT